MLTALIEFIQRLRDAAIPVSMVETLDAVEALKHVDLSNREQFQTTLGATLVKRAEHRAAFAALFDVSFAPRRAGPSPSGGAAGPLATAALTDPTDIASSGGASGELLAALLDALRRNDEGALRALAALAVEQFGGINAQRVGSTSASYYLYRVLRQLDLSNLLQRAIHDQGQETDDTTPFDQRLLRDEQRRRIEEFRRLITEEIRQRLVDLKGPRAAAEAYRHVPIEDVDVLGATPTQLREMRDAIRPLAQKLAARIAHRRRARRHGRLDARKTIRRSLSAGGVPLEPAFRYPKVSRPDLYLLCDVSGSVAEFARFTMSFLHAMNEEFSRIRSFAFVDGIDEVTAVFEDRDTPLDAPHLLARANVVWADGHSDYGHVFERFWTIYGQAGLGPRTTVIITGDGRNNYRAPGIEALRAIKEPARKVYWLNPDPRRLWDTADSIIAAYAPHCDGVFEVRNLRQLADFVRGIA
jgi:prepilin-type processing-associated H-X9-DG protein